MLVIDFGTYPFVTSSNTVTAGLCTGLGIAPKWVGKVFGISKAYCTRVGGGPFPTELDNATGERLRELGHEFGATTGRPRRCGWIDLVALRYACMINGVTDILVTKADVLDGMDDIKVCTAYEINGEQTQQFPFDIQHQTIEPVYTTLPVWEKPLASCVTAADLPPTFMQLTELIRTVTGVPVTCVSNGVGRDALIAL
jgi:adenylosuccinate synthase